MNVNRILLTAAAVVILSSVSVHASEMDERIESSARESHVFKTYLKDDSVRVQSTDGVVTLTGDVKDAGDKSLAEDTVAGLPGVTSVNNQLQVKGEQPDKNSDGWISAKVKAALLFHTNVSGMNTQVSVMNGVVTLRGEAGSQAEKDLASKYAMDIDGVKSVSNEIAIVPVAPKSETTMKEKIDDASVGAQVKMALLTHRSTSAIRTKVDAKDGIVTLTGVAKNDAEKALVTEIVKDIKGVQGVVNNMQVQS